MNPINLTLEEEMLSRLDDLVPMVGQSAAAREFGVKVDRNVVARVALLRGLAVMEAAVPAKPPDVVESAPDSVLAPPPALVLPAISDDPPPSTAETVESASDLDVRRDDDGLISPPEGWNRWSDAERVPAEQSAVHEYYKSGGFQRYWGRSGEEVIVFYWSPDETKHDFPMYKNLDMNRKEIKLQNTPYGPGHLVPHGWSE
tara:strand:- start:2444 stop:3046 length:603 start_codon:yes stop_codon:yes gene_type:complete